MSSAPSSTAGSNATAANQSAQQPGAGAGGSGGGAENGHVGGAAGNGAEGNAVQREPEAGSGGAGENGSTEPPTSSSATSHHRGPAASGTTGTITTVLRRKTNVCLICGIYTNLSLNIFEPRNGPNIVDVIYEKYKFRAERGDNADKHICFSCNNWLINWYSLQNTSSGSSRTYEPAPSTSRSSSTAADSSNNRRHHQGHKSRTKSTAGGPFPLSDKENCPIAKMVRAEQNDQVSSTTAFIGGEESLGLVDQYRRHYHHHPYVKRTRRAALRESNARQVLQQRLNTNNRFGEQPAEDDFVDVVSSSTQQQQQPAFDLYTMLVKPFETQLIRMLEGQGTTVTKESGHQRDGEDENSGSRPRERWQPLPNRAGGNRSNRRNRAMCTRKRLAATRSPDDSTPFEDEHDTLEEDDTANEIVLSFDTALSEVIDVVPSLKAIRPWWSNDVSETGNKGSENSLLDPVGPLRQRLSSGALSMSIIDVEESGSNSILW